MTDFSKNVPATAKAVEDFFRGTCDLHELRGVLSQVPANTHAAHIIRNGVSTFQSANELKKIDSSINPESHAAVLRDYFGLLKSPEFCEKELGQGGALPELAYGETKAYVDNAKRVYNKSRTD